MSEYTHTKDQPESHSGDHGTGDDQTTKTSSTGSEQLFECLDRALTFLQSIEGDRTDQSSKAVTSKHQSSLGYQEPTRRVSDRP